MVSEFLYSQLRSKILPLQKIDKVLPQKGTIIDLGCGQGTIASFLAQNKKRNVIGVDINTKRLPKNQLKNLTFVAADITRYQLPQATGVIISDVLHHLPMEKQAKLLAKIVKGLRRGDVLVIKEIDKSQAIRSLFSRLWDLLLYPNERIHYRDSKSQKAYLQKLGLKVTISHHLRLFPGSTTLFVCQK